MPQLHDTHTVLRAQLRELRYATPHVLPPSITPVADWMTAALTFRPVAVLKVLRSVVTCLGGGSYGLYGQGGIGSRASECNALSQHTNMPCTHPPTSILKGAKSSSVLEAIRFLRDCVKVAAGHCTMLMKLPPVFRVCGQYV